MISSWTTASESAARMDKRFPSAWVFRRSRFARSRSAARKSENSFKMMHELKQIAERVIKRANKSCASAAALKADKAIVNSEGAAFEYARSRVTLANSLGFLGAYEGTVSTLVCVPVAQCKDGMQRDHWMSAARHCNHLESPEEVGKKAAER